MVRFYIDFILFLVAVLVVEIEWLQLLIYYWQYHNIFEDKLWPIFKSKHAKQKKLQSAKIVVVLSILFIMFFLTAAVAKSFNDERSNMFSYSTVGSFIRILNNIVYFKVFDHPVQIAIGHIFGYYMMIVFLALNYYYLTATSIIHAELVDFNHRLKVSK